MAAREQISVLVTRVLAANAVITREIASLQMQAESEGGDLAALSAAVDDLTALAMVHAPLPEQTAGSMLEKAQAAADATSAAAADSASKLDGLLGTPHADAATYTLAEAIIDSYVTPA